MNHIIEPHSSFDFSTISLTIPTGIQGGAYFTKIQCQSKPLYIQTTKSQSKQGIVKAGKKYYCDLMFDNNSEEIIQWFENLEERCQQLIYEKADTWFQNALEMNDVESAFNSMIRVYKSGKYYLVRVHAKNNQATGNPSIKIYDENEIPLTFQDIHHDTNMISILEIQGIKFTTRNFQIEIELKQIMVLNEPIFENCLIKKSNYSVSQKNGPSSSSSSSSSSLPQETTFQTSIERKMNEKEGNETSLVKTKLESSSSTEQSSDSLFHQPDVGEKQKDSINQEKSNTPSTQDQMNLEMIDPYSLEVFEPTFPEDSVPLETNEDHSTNQSGDSKQPPNEPDTEKPTSGSGDSTDSTDPPPSSLPQESEDLKEFRIHLENTDMEPSITLKKPNEVYFDLYKQARAKAKLAKKNAILAYLEAKNIKKTYMLEHLNENSDEEDDFDAEIDDVSENDLEDLEYLEEES